MPNPMNEAVLAEIESIVSRQSSEGMTHWIVDDERMTNLDIMAVLIEEVQRLRRKLDQPFTEGIVERRQGGVVLRGTPGDLLEWLADA